MDLYEYQGKELFRRFGIPVSDGRLATSPEDARTAAHPATSAIMAFRPGLMRYGLAARGNRPLS